MKTIKGNVQKALAALTSAAITNNQETDLNDRGRCFLKTKGNNFKEYLILLTDSGVVFSRPKSAKQQELKYEYSQF